MFAAGSTLVMMAVAIVAAFACVITVVGAIQLTADRKHGYFHLVIPAILITSGLTIALSGRSMEFNAVQLMTDTVVRNPLSVWVQRIGTIVILTISLERIISHFSRQPTLLGAAPMLTLCFVAYWAGSTLSPMLFSAYPAFSHESCYALIIGVGALLLTAEEGEQVLLTARDSMFALQLASYLMIFINAGLVLDTNYTQGFIPGLPRFSGLAPHALTMGMMAQLSLLCLWTRPYANQRLNRAAWTLGLLSLLLAQSKTGWISFFFCATVMYLCQHSTKLRHRLSDATRPQLGITLTLGITIIIAGVGFAALFGGLDTRLDSFLHSESGAQLTSLTGRDVIWAVAYEEWLRHPVFGYGPNFLSLPYRLGIGLPNATHGHNQYMDLLPRAGLIGAIPLTVYLFAMLSLSVRHAVASRGLTLALFIAIALRAISEVPLTMRNGYSPEFISHLLLLVLLTACNARFALFKEKPAGTTHLRTSPQT